MGDKKIFLNVGCGARGSEHMINIDIRKYNETVDIVCDIRNSIPFPENSVYTIYSSSVLEHFSKYEWKDILKYWYSLLVKGGELQISTMDFDKICERYSKTKDVESLIGLINGGSKENFYFDRHGMMYNYELLNNVLNEIGFVNIRECQWSEFYPYKMDSNYDDYSRSYIPHMDFENGSLMTLNIIAEK